MNPEPSILPWYMRPGFHPPGELDEQPWDISEDFLKPLGDLLDKWGMRRAWQKWPAVFAPRLNDNANPADCIVLFLGTAAPSARNLACVWLEVNVSIEVADKVKRLLDELQEVVLSASEKGEWPDTMTAGRYLLNLARVLRQRQGHQIAKGDLQQDDDDFRGPFTVDELTNGNHGKRGLLRVSKRTFYRRMKEHGAMFKQVGNLFYVHRSLLPDDD